MDTQIERVMSNYSTIPDLIAEEVAARSDERAFYVANMQDIYEKHVAWMRLLPRVKPFYAVKCNNLQQVVSFLARLGTGFDCASKQEIDQVLSLGVSPSNIIYANPCKTRGYIKHAATVGVNTMTFDNELELHKIAALHTNAKLVLRIKGDDRFSRCKFNIKFGADFDKCESLLELASQLGLNVIGVSFHNGSDCEDATAYDRIISACKQVFEIGEMLGHSMYLLDIGGGFPGYQAKGSKLNFEDYASVINAAIDRHFPQLDPLTGEQTKYQVIAEPGRYYVASAFDFIGMIIAKKVVRNEKTGEDCFSYYLNDGVYGAFNNTLFDHEIVTPQIVEKLANEENIKSLANNKGANKRKHITTIWGPTCDSMDCIKRDFMFPEVEVGEWIVFRNMGAYTHCAASNFNGFDKASVIVAI